MGEKTDGRWSAERAREWYADKPWPCGFNFLPSSAVNFVDMWHPETFDPATTLDPLWQAWSQSEGLQMLHPRSRLPITSAHPVSPTLTSVVPLETTPTHRRRG